MLWRGLCLGLVLICGVVWAADDRVPVPALQAQVTDLTGTLSPPQQSQLEQTLSAFEKRKGSQIAVLIVPTTQPETIEQYAIRVATAWKLGRKDIDDGALLLIAKEDRTLRIEVGYGLEGAIPDAVANRIIDEIITPYFKQGDFYGGIQAGIDRLARVVEGEPLPAPVSGPVSGKRSSAPDNLGQLIPLIFFAVLLGGGLLRAMLGRFPGALAVGGITALVLWFLLSSLLMAIIVGIIAAVITLGGGMGRGGSWRSGGSGGGFGGGGFGGGGGGFGGGGASGRW